MSQKITTLQELRTFAIIGLGLGDEAVQLHITNHPSDIGSAAYDLLKQWRERKPNGRVAYANILHAIDAANLKSYKDALM